MASQAPHATLLIPGPVEFDGAVLQSMSHFSESHLGAAFVSIFSEVLAMLRRLFQTSNPASQPFVLAGSGTLGWDLVAANLVERGDEALVLHTGYFADSFAACLETYGVKATQLKAPVGSRPELSGIEQALRDKAQDRPYDMVAITHVDTSTGVLSDVKAVSELVHDLSPDTLVVVDGVCSVGSEEVRFDDWGLDVVLTASQKGIGCPAGLSISMVSERAMQRFEARKTPPAAYFASMRNWLPIMRAYSSHQPAYFATPPTQLIHALHTALTQLLSAPLEARWAAHRAASHKVKAAITALKLRQVPADRESQANSMTAFYLPEGVGPAEVLPAMLQRGVLLAGGLHREIAGRYVRWGHMGVSVTDPKRTDLDKAIRALREVLSELGHQP